MASPTGNRALREDSRPRPPPLSVGPARRTGGLFPSPERPHRSLSPLPFRDAAMVHAAYEARPVDEAFPHMKITDFTNHSQRDFPLEQRHHIQRAADDLLNTFGHYPVVTLRCLFRQVEAALPPPPLSDAGCDSGMTSRHGRGTPNKNRRDSGGHLYKKMERLRAAAAEFLTGATITRVTPRLRAPNPRRKRSRTINSVFRVVSVFVVFPASFIFGTFSRMSACLV